MDTYDVDAQLLASLQQNARYTATELATRVGVSDDTIHNRMQRLEDAGIITGDTTIVDHDRTGSRCTSASSLPHESAIGAGSPRERWPSRRRPK